MAPAGNVTADGTNRTHHLSGGETWYRREAPGLGKLPLGEGSNVAGRNSERVLDGPAGQTPGFGHFFARYLERCLWRKAVELCRIPPKPFVAIFPHRPHNASNHRRHACGTGLAAVLQFIEHPPRCGAP